VIGPNDTVLEICYSVVILDGVEEEDEVVKEVLGCFQKKFSKQKILHVKSLFNTVKIFRATLFFRSSAKLLKNPEW